MFGIGLPELILIMAVALIVVGPDKLPGMAKTIAKQLVELKKAASTLKDSLNEEMKDEDDTSWRDIEPKGSLANEIKLIEDGGIVRPEDTGEGVNPSGVSEEEVTADKGQHAEIVEDVTEDEGQASELEEKRDGQ